MKNSSKRPINKLKSKAIRSMVISLFLIMGSMGSTNSYAGGGHWVCLIYHLGARVPVGNDFLTAALLCAWGGGELAFHTPSGTDISLSGTVITVPF